MAKVKELPTIKLEGNTVVIVDKQLGEFRITDRESFIHFITKEKLEEIIIKFGGTVFWGTDK